ncbi:sulfatase [Flavihumibacter sp. CACIAM 22H1]|uniref:sulfatase family protein n=1 Tax=Flavihumibacter sp. CACIAM 22H1 TaxID=1812911 RepID=UPI0007A80CAB|nr:sulfatase [Flavihumibacter sp. CACIAM 22H1]KYP16584.1 MAG: arylsulfatase [Flavihumibacter sp. CACIAM 22H1]
MRKSHFALLFGCSVLVSFKPEAMPEKKERPPSKPNVVLIFMDDMGYGDPVCYGGGPYQTPNLDKLAYSGIRFTNFYAAQAVCTASRSALLTGCYPTRIGISGAIDHNAKFGLNTNEETIPELLKKSGYKTGMVGKWHLGHVEPYLPLQHGFDEYLGIPYSNDMWPVYYDGTPWTDTTSYRSTYPVLPLIEGNKPIEYIRTLQDQSQLTRRFTERAIQFIQKNKKSPFFLYLAHPMVHTPIAASEKFKGKSKGGLFGDVMEEVDWSIGAIMKTLEENRLLENTLVIFTSDNGPWLTFGNHAGNTGGLREGKGTAWDGGVKVPCIMSWKGTLPAGVVNNQLATTMEILPTLTSLCGAPSPKLKIDGINMAGVLTGKSTEIGRKEFVYYYDKNNLKAIRNERFKLVFAAQSQTYGPPALPGKDGFPGKHGTDSVKLALYDLWTDPGEDRDVQLLYPEVIKELHSIADQYRKMLGDGLTKMSGLEVRPAGVL